MLSKFTALIVPPVTFLPQPERRDGWAPAARHNRSMDWHCFLEGEEPVVLTTILPHCDEGRHDECPGFMESEEHGGEPIFCVCWCHRVAPEV